MCGLVGGGPLQVEYLLNLRVLFDYFYPGVIPGTVFEIPEWLDFDAHVVPAVSGAIATFPLRAAEMAGVDQLGIQYTSTPELIGSILSGLYYNIVGTEDLLGRTHARIMVGNIDTEYTGSSDDDALNDGVQRFEATPDAAYYLEHWYQPSGKLAIPVVTLHLPRGRLCGSGLGRGKIRHVAAVARGRVRPLRIHGSRAGRRIPRAKDVGGDGVEANAVG
jgi:hypothetical protein